MMITVLVAWHTGSNKMAKSQKMVTITEEEYDQLFEDSRFLEALRAAGVDNWNGYEVAQEMIEEWDAES